jgi:hypothetical protein
LHFAISGIHVWRDRLSSTPDNLIMKQRPAKESVKRKYRA